MVCDCTVNTGSYRSHAPNNDMNTDVYKCAGGDPWKYCNVRLCERDVIVPSFSLTEKHVGSM